jgi:hypothetical protein
MQPHEGPRRDRDADERSRQRALTRRLSVVILLLGVALAAVWFLRA